MIMKGDIPDVMVKHEVDLILQRAMIMCLQFNPEKRSSAKEIYRYLANELKEMEERSSGNEMYIANELKEMAM